jgi:histidyl-tRNA synthetase
MLKPALPKGTRDYNATQIYKRQYIFDTIKQVFEIYGYHPIETPSMELLEVLSGKYGEEGDALLFKVLNNGDFLSKADESALADRNSSALVPSISKRGLRYDLTVPFARYVVMHQHEIQLPFKRYQMQPVWRADRPQKGRYQEFYQCDADVVGSKSLLYEAEFIMIYDRVFTKLGLNTSIRVNNRKILSGIATVGGIADKFIEFTVCLDKLDKIGFDGVRNELSLRDIDPDVFELVEQVLAAGNDFSKIRTVLAESSEAQEGLDEVETAFRLAGHGKPTQELLFDITLARGLNYYTGCIFEVKSSDIEMGSIGGGGRYDDLTAAFGLSGVPGIGISFGAERIFDAMESLDLWPDSLSKSALAILLPMDQQALEYAMPYAEALRDSGIPVEFYPEPAKAKKQFKYASDRGFHYALICGEAEINASAVSVKDLWSGVQEMMSWDELSEMLRRC